MSTVHIYNRHQAIHQLWPSGQDAFISIEYGRYSDEVPMVGWKDTLKLCFADYDIATFGCDEILLVGKESLMFSDDQALQAVEFIQRNLGSDFHVHCDAGVSWSAAFGFFIANQFGYRFQSHTGFGFKHHNAYVRQQLEKAIEDQEARGE